MIDSSRAEIVVSTYNNPFALDLCLCALAHQTIQDFRICVADDGSGSETQEVIAYWLEKYKPGRLRHIWHPDKGFRKNRILNQAIASSVADYLIMLDGDCLMSPGVVHRHLAMAHSGAFMSSGVVRLPGSASAVLSRDLIAEGVVFGANWLAKHARMRFQDRLKLGIYPLVLVSLIEKLSPVKRTWNGGHSSAWRRDLLAVNGYDETMRYGGEDIELGFRLNNAGIRGQHLRYSTLVLHVDHTRGYVNQDEIAKNKLLIQQTRLEHRVRTPFGINAE